jgi:hypothetical protein
MAYTIWAVARSALTITGTSGGSGLSGLTQGDGSHLVGATIVWNGGGWEEIRVTDNDPNFDDNDTGQTVRQTIWGVTYNNRVIEAEYRIVLRAPDGTTYTAIGVNVNEPGGNPAFGSIEGLAFIGDAPPVGVSLQVISAREGPGSSGQPATQAPVYYVPPCFTPGVLIRTEAGARPVEDLAPGDMIWTLDHGFRPLVRLLSRRIGAAALAADPALWPVVIRADALGPGRPARDLSVSPQHRVLVVGWRSALIAGAEEVLVPARALVDGVRAAVDREAEEVTYLHLVFDRHEIVESEGMLSESYLPGPLTRAGLAPEERADIPPTLAPARPGARGAEAALLAPARAESARIG